MSTRLNDPNGICTPEQAKADIQTGTTQENLFKPIFEAHHRDYGRNIKVFDNGVDNSGKFIPDERLEAVRHLLKKPDWRIEGLEGITLLEAMVHSERYQQSGFKEEKLKRCIRDNVPIIVLRETYFDIYIVSFLNELLLTRNTETASGLPYQWKDTYKYGDELPTRYGSWKGRTLWYYEIPLKYGKIIRQKWSSTSLKMIEQQNDILFDE